MIHGRRFIFRNQSTSRTFAVEGSSTVVLPTEASLVIGGQAPLVSISITPDTVSLVITGQQPSAAIPVAYLSWAEFRTPGSPGAVVIQVGSAALTIDGQIPATSGGTLTAQPAAVGLTITGQTPTVDRTTSSISAAPSSTTLTLTAQTLTIGSGILVPTATNTRTFVWTADPLAAGYEIGYSTVSGTYSTLIDVGNVLTYDLTLSNGTYYVNIRAYDSQGTRGAWTTEQTFVANGIAVTAQEPMRFFSTLFFPATLSLVLEGQAPAVTVPANVSISPSEGALTLTGQAPVAALSAHQFITVPVTSLTVTPQTPTFVATGNWVITPSNAAIAIAGVAPSVIEATPNVVLPSNGALLISGLAPTLSYDYIRTPANADLTLTGIAFTIFVGNPQYAAPSVAQLVIQGQDVSGVHGGSWTGIPIFAELVLNTFAPNLSQPSGVVPAGSSRRHDKPKRRRWQLPNGMHVFATDDEVVELAQRLTDRPVVIQHDKKKPRPIRLNDGALGIPDVIRPVEQRRIPQTDDLTIAGTQIARSESIDIEAVMALLSLEIQHQRRRRAATLLLL